MKKFGILISLFALAALFSNSFAQDSKTLSNGFSVNLVVGFPSAEFGAESTDVMPSSMEYGTLWGIKLGNRWYFAPQEKFGFGLMVNWLDFAAGFKSGTETYESAFSGSESFDWARTTFDVTLLGVGPIGTYAINDDIAIDGYYNLRPTLLVSGNVTTDPQGVAEDETYGYAGFGITNTLGAAFRWKVLNVGVEYVFGKVNCQGKYTGPTIAGELEDGDLPDAKLSTNSVRLVLGVKF